MQTVKTKTFGFGDYVESEKSAREFICDNPRFNNSDYVVFPGFCDVHVHLREPGFSYKETIATGTMSAACGGYTAVCSMPNLNPVPDNVENLKVQTDIITRDAVVNVYPYGAITVGQKGEKLSDMQALAEDAIAFSDDGKGVQSEEKMRLAMLTAKSLGKIVVAHCEDESLLRGGYIHDGEYAAKNSHRGICGESEWKQIERDLSLVRETGCAYHVCHISCKESVELIAKAKREGLNVTCETAPHYLILDENDLKEDGRYKMNPPLRGKEDRLALIEGLKNRTIDMIATDHAPHSSEEKSKGLEKSAFGVVGLETAFPMLYTKLVKEGVVGLERVLEALVIAPRKRFNIPLGKDFSVWNLNKKYTINSEKFASKGRATPFSGEQAYGKLLVTVVNGKIICEK